MRLPRKVNRLETECIFSLVIRLIPKCTISPETESQASMVLLDRVQRLSERRLLKWFRDGQQQGLVVMTRIRKTLLKKPVLNGCQWERTCLKIVKFLHWKNTCTNSLCERGDRLIFE